MDSTVGLRERAVAAESEQRGSHGVLPSRREPCKPRGSARRTFVRK